jgi:hypothetical protein
LHFWKGGREKFKKCRGGGVKEENGAESLAPNDTWTNGNFPNEDKTLLKHAS